MKAAIATKYGSPDVLQLKEVEKPTPSDNEVLIKVHATTVSSGDVRIRSFNSPLLAWLPMRIMLGFTGPRKKVLGFAIAGKDSAFTWAEAKIDGETVVVNSPYVENPIAVRYAWASNPMCNLYNNEGLPASPFRTDEWPGLTWPKEGDK